MDKKEEKHKHSLKLAKGAAINFTGFIGGRGLLFLYTIFLARVLKTSDLGLYFLGVTITDILTVLANMGLIYGVKGMTAGELQNLD